MATAVAIETSILTCTPRYKTAGTAMAMAMAVTMATEMSKIVHCLRNRLPDFLAPIVMFEKKITFEPSNSVQIANLIFSLCLCKPGL